jgi:arylsulfatase A-like enzyme
MRIRTKLFCLLFFCPFILFAQQKAVPRPKLVVGLMVDQMRWDYLYRYYDRYGNMGFKRLLKDGFSCEQTFIPYAPTVTAAGHACVYTGSVPAINGIAGNSWFSRELNRTVYCTEDSTVQTVGASGKEGMMSPRNMLTTTVSDELMLATNFKSKVMGIAIKDRGAILPAGHRANAAYWYDGGSGNWISSTYYMNALPAWVNTFNAGKMPDKLYAQNWNTLYPIGTYAQSTADAKAYEGKEGTNAFPHQLDKYIGKNYGAISSTPYGNTLTLAFARNLIEQEAMGHDQITDLLAVSLSSPDYIGHQYGPNSIEIEDQYLRLDKELGDFLTYLDTRIGKGNYLVFLTADHGVAHVPGFMQENKLPAGTVNTGELLSKLNMSLTAEFGNEKLATKFTNYQFYIDRMAAGKDLAAIKAAIIRFALQQPGIADAMDVDAISTHTIPATIKEMLLNGYNVKRGGDVQVVFQPQWIDGWATGTTHGLWNPYDAHIPLVWFGWNIKPGKSNTTSYMSDIAPTLAALLHIQMPNGAVGKVIGEVVK